MESLNRCELTGEKQCFQIKGKPKCRYYLSI